MASDLARYLVLLGCTRTIPQLARWYLAPFPMIHTQSADPTGGGSTGVWVLGLRPSGTVLAGADVIATLLGSDGALAAIAVPTVLILFGPPVAEGSLRWTSAVWVSWSPVWRYVCDSVLRNLRRPLLMIDQKPTIARICSTSIYRRNMAEFMACFSSGPWAIADASNDATTKPLRMGIIPISCVILHPSRALVPRSPQFSSVPTFFTVSSPLSTRSCTHSSLSARCLTRPTPRRWHMPLAADESVKHANLVLQPISWRILWTIIPAADPRVIA